MPLVSVFMPFHRVTPFLGPAVASILNQTLRDLELILIDNGTGAGTDAFGEEGRDPRVRLLRHESNIGVAAAHNAARAVARGEFIANMDSDDVAQPARLERQLAEFDADPALGLLAAHAMVIDEHGSEIRPQFTLTSERDVLLFSAYSLPVTNPTLMGRRVVFDRFPMRPLFAVSSDYDFFARAVEAYPCRALPDTLLQYRRHGAQLTVKHFPTMVFNACVIRLLTARRRAGRKEGIEELAAEFRDWFAQPPPPADCYARFSEQALREGFPLLAVYLARRSFSARREAGVLARATRMLGAAIRQAPEESVSLLRMYATGPVRTHGLRPVR